jgi:hypothetical protein
MRSIPLHPGVGGPATRGPEQEVCSAGGAASGDKVHQGRDQDHVQRIQAGRKKTTIQ